MIHITLTLMDEDMNTLDIGRLPHRKWLVRNGEQLEPHWTDHRDIVDCYARDAKGEVKYADIKVEQLMTNSNVVTVVNCYSYSVSRYYSQRHGRSYAITSI